MERGAEFLKENELIDYPDQDILNYFFSQETRVLPEKYNTLVSWELSHRRNELEPRIYHYANKQYAFDYSNNYHRLFFDTFAGTHWCNTDFLFNLARAVRRSAGANYLIYSNLVAGRTRVVVGKAADRENHTKMLMLRENETYLTVEELNKRGFRLEPGEILVIFLPPEEYMKVKKHLETCGCMEGAHFINGSMLTMPDAAQDAQAFLEA